MTTDLWVYQDETWLAGHDLVGYDVEARDGGIGTIDEATFEVDGSYILVDTGPWIFGKQVMLPAGVIDAVDHDAEKVFLECTKEEIKQAPEFDADRYDEASYQTELGAYYRGMPAARERDI